MKKIVHEGWKIENDFKIGYLNLLSTYIKQVIQKDPNGRLMRSKSWPLYDDLCEIFGQSRATGETVVSHLRATTPPPSFSANIDVDDASFKVGDEKQDESKSPFGCAQTGESTDMGNKSSAP
ncbi:hypothetical protein ACS0TY_005917 [Phlomoides rotata]